MTVIKLSALAAGVIGGAMALSGATPASAASLAPALAQSGEHAAGVQKVHERRTNRSSRRYGRNYGYRYGNRFYRSGPSVSFGLSVPGFSFGIGTPRAYSHRYSRSHGYRYGYPRYYGY